MPQKAIKNIIKLLVLSINFGRNWFIKSTPVRSSAHWRPTRWSRPHRRKYCWIRGADDAVPPLDRRQRLDGHDAVAQGCEVSPRGLPCWRRVLYPALKSVLYTKNDFLSCNPIRRLFFFSFLFFPFFLFFFKRGCPRGGGANLGPLDLIYFLIFTTLPLSRSGSPREDFFNWTVCTYVWPNWAVRQKIHFTC
jgi:hypothetical protein